MRLISFITFNISSVDRKGGILLNRKGVEHAKYGLFQHTIIPIGRYLGLVATLWFYCIGYLNPEVL
jgi:hypothetical protein